MRRPGEGIEGLIRSEKRFLVAGWSLSARGMEWFQGKHLSPLMVEMHNRTALDRKNENVGIATIRRVADRLGSLGLVEQEWVQATNTNSRPVAGYRVTEAGMELAPSFYVQLELPQINDTTTLVEWLAKPLSQLALYNIPLEPIENPETLVPLSQIR